MNARLPLYTGPTANPCADAERWSDEQEHSDALREEAEKQAPLIIFARLQAIRKPGDWFNKTLPGARSYTADEVLMDAVASDDDTLNAYTELLTSPQAQKLRQCMAAWQAKQQPLDIYLDHIASTNDAH